MSYSSFSVVHAGREYDPSVLMAQADLAHCEQVKTELIVHAEQVQVAKGNRGNFAPVAVKYEGKYVLLIAPHNWEGLDGKAEIELRIISKPALKKSLI